MEQNGGSKATKDSHVILSMRKRYKRVQTKTPELIQSYNLLLGRARSGDASDEEVMAFLRKDRVKRGPDGLTGVARRSRKSRASSAAANNLKMGGCRFPNCKMKFYVPSDVDPEKGYRFCHFHVRSSSWALKRCGFLTSDYVEFGEQGVRVLTQFYHGDCAAVVVGWLNPPERWWENCFCSCPTCVCRDCRLQFGNGYRIIGVWTLRERMALGSFVQRTSIENESNCVYSLDDDKVVIVITRDIPAGTWHVLGFRMKRLICLL